MLHVSSLLNSPYSSESDIENIMDDCLVEFLVETNFNDFAEVFLEISNMKIKNIRWDNRKDQKILQIISFVYSRIMDFPPNNFEIKTVITKTFLDDVKNILLASHVIHHSHVTGNIIGYMHDFCNKKIRENQNPIPVFAHNLFSFNFFFVVKGRRLCVWRTKRLNIGRSNLTNVQYANIVSQVKFIDTIKYYQQSLSSLAKSTDENKKGNTGASCEKFIQNIPHILQAFLHFQTMTRNGF